MADTWQMRVWSPDGTSKATITPESAVLSLDTFDVDAAGSCGEATFTALPSAVDLKPRDIIWLRTSPDGGATFTGRWRGYIVIAGDPRAEEVQTYRAIGLRQRFYEAPLRIPVVIPGDVAAMAAQILDDSILPEGVTFSSADAPTTGFQLGPRYPRLETIGDALDALAETVGRFIVPTGAATYTYDGVSYNPGDTVPAVHWGVDADGSAFFRRPQGAPIAVTETQRLTLVEWQPVSAEEATDTVVLAYGNPDAFPQPFSAAIFEALPAGLQYSNLVEPVTRTLGSGTANPTGERIARTVILDTPVDFMVDTGATLDTWSGAPDFTVWSNPGYAVDGDRDTYAEYNPSTTTGGRLEIQPAAPGTTGIWRIRYEASQEIELIIDLDDGTKFTRIFYRLPGTDGEIREVFVLASPAVEYTGGAITGHELWVRALVGPQTLHVYEATFYAPDVDDNETGSISLAEGFERPLNPVAAVHRYGVEAHGSAVSLTPATGGTLALPIERTSYAATTDPGFVTTYHVGQSYEASLESERAVLERLARRAVAGGGARR